MSSARPLLPPSLPLIVPDTPLRACVLQAKVRLQELSYWPRRRVAAVALLDGTNQGACGHPRVYTLLCLN